MESGKADMNQLIEKIMNQADEVNIPENDEFVEIDFLADIDPRRVNLFAQMIIKECQSHAEQYHTLP